MADNERPRELIERLSDIGEWGEKPDRGNRDYQKPFMVAGEAVDLDKLPALSSVDKPPSESPPRTRTEGRGSRDRHADGR